jgi:hypothetical protein
MFSLCVCVLSTQEMMKQQAITHSPSPRNAHPPRRISPVCAGYDSVELASRPAESQPDTAPQPPDSAHDAGQEVPPVQLPSAVPGLDQEDPLLQLQSSVPVHPPRSPSEHVMDTCEDKTDAIPASNQQSQPAVPEPDPFLSRSRSAASVDADRETAGCGPGQSAPILQPTASALQTDAEVLPTAAPDVLSARDCGSAMENRSAPQSTSPSELKTPEVTDANQHQSGGGGHRNEVTAQHGEADVSCSFSELGGGFPNVSYQLHKMDCMADITGTTHNVSGAEDGSINISTVNDTLLKSGVSPEPGGSRGFHSLSSRSQCHEQSEQSVEAAVLDGSYQSYAFRGARATADADATKGSASADAGTTGIEQQDSPTVAEAHQLSTRLHPTSGTDVDRDGSAGRSALPDASALQEYADLGAADEDERQPAVQYCAAPPCLSPEQVKPSTVEVPDVSQHQSGSLTGDAPATRGGLRTAPGTGDSTHNVSNDGPTAGVEATSGVLAGEVGVIASYELRSGHANLASEIPVPADADASYSFSDPGGGFPNVSYQLHQMDCTADITGSTHNLSEMEDSSLNLSIEDGAILLAGLSPVSGGSRGVISTSLFSPARSIARETEGVSDGDEGGKGSGGLEDGLDRLQETPGGNRSPPTALEDVATLGEVSGLNDVASLHGSGLLSLSVDDEIAGDGEAPAEACGLAPESHEVSENLPPAVTALETTAPAVQGAEVENSSGEAPRQGQQQVVGQVDADAADVAYHSAQPVSAEPSNVQVTDVGDEVQLQRGDEGGGGVEATLGEPQGTFSHCESPQRVAGLAAVTPEVPDLNKLLPRQDAHAGNRTCQQPASVGAGGTDQLQDASVLPPVAAPQAEPPTPPVQDVEVEHSSDDSDPGGQPSSRGSGGAESLRDATVLPTMASENRQFAVTPVAEQSTPPVLVDAEGQESCGGGVVTDGVFQQQTQLQEDGLAEPVPPMLDTEVQESSSDADDDIALGTPQHQEVGTDSGASADAAFSVHEAKSGVPHHPTAPAISPVAVEPAGGQATDGSSDGERSDADATQASQKTLNPDEPAGNMSDDTTAISEAPKSDDIHRDARDGDYRAQPPAAQVDEAGGGGASTRDVSVLAAERQEVSEHLSRARTPQTEPRTPAESVADLQDSGGRAAPARSPQKGQEGATRCDSGAPADAGDGAGEASADEHGQPPASDGDGDGEGGEVSWCLKLVCGRVHWRCHHTTC